MLGAVATVCIVTIEVGLVTYNLNKSGALDSMKDKLFKKKNKAKDTTDKSFIMEAEVVS